MSWTRVTEALRTALELSDDSVGLVETLLPIGWGVDADFDMASSLAQIDGWSAAVAGAIAASSTETEAREEIAALERILFTREKFVGDRAQYYDPRNSLMHRVLERRRGMPILLAAIYIDVARRAGLAVEGVGFPGHFLVKHTQSSPATIVDPFSNGRILDQPACRKLLREMHGDGVPFRPSMLDSVSRREIVLRVLRNLKGCYARIGDLPNAVGVVTCLLDLDPGALMDRRDRAAYQLALGDLSAAYRDLEEAWDRAPAGPMRESLRELRERVRADMARLN